MSGLDLLDLRNLSTFTFHLGLALVSTGTERLSDLMRKLRAQMTEAEQAEMRRLLRVVLEVFDEPAT